MVSFVYRQCSLLIRPIAFKPDDAVGEEESDHCCQDGEADREDSG